MTKARRPIELLAPAKNLECGMAAIDHGADAVYIGADSFGARVSAGNTTDSIAELCRYAHVFGAKVYVTVNTIIFENELAKADRLIGELVKIGVDAILVQDMAVLELIKKYGDDVPELHASTQTDNRNTEKVKWLHSVGFKRVVLARELSLEEIKHIHAAAPDVELEAFVHGALCVSYSGACYASLHCFNRSANRGECAQFCRLKFDLYDDNGKLIEQDRHLLSLKDMSQYDVVEQLMDAGVTSLKIEGRLKNADYVKNVVAAYSQRIDEIIARRSDEYRRASYGRVEYSFTPNLNKTFNRGFTHYFFNGRQPGIESFDTPKAIGEYVGYVKEIRGTSFNVAGTAMFANGDGLCFITKDHKLEGFRVNRVENNRLFPLSMPHNLQAGMALYRNNDQEFERILSRKTAERKLDLYMALRLNNGQLQASANDETGRSVDVKLDIELQKAIKPQHENIARQMEKLGNTPFRLAKLDIAEDVDAMFVPSSRLSELRREIVNQLSAARIPTECRNEDNVGTEVAENGNRTNAHTINAANVANHLAQEFYATHGVVGAAKAHESDYAGDSAHRKSEYDYPIMTCRFCLRYALGHCVNNGGEKPTWKEPLYLQLPDGKKFRLSFNCKKCQMEIYAKN